jgi:transposase
VHYLLDKLGFSFKKTTLIPSKTPSIEVQEAFIKRIMQLINHLTTGQYLYFIDAVHPQHNTRSKKLWILKGKQHCIASNSGRERVNINAAIDSLTLQVVHTHNEATINAQSTERLYNKLIAKHPDATKIYIIADNARYYNNKKLVETFKNTVIEVIHLPPYCPNLNLIERLWKWLRAKIDTVYFEKLAAFEEKIFYYLDNTLSYADELKSLLTLNFQIINK